MAEAKIVRTPEQMGEESHATQIAICDSGHVVIMLFREGSDFPYAESHLDLDQAEKIAIELREAAKKVRGGTSN